MGAVLIDLPSPVSTNALYANIPGKGRIKTKKYRSWVAQAHCEVIRQGQHKKRVSGQYSVMIEVSRSSGNDVDNNAKCILDFLGPRGIGITADDRHCHSLTVIRSDVAGARVTIFHRGKGKIR